MSRLRRVRPGADFQVHVGFRQLQLIEEHLRHVGVVVLTGVDAICSNAAGYCAISRMPVLSRVLSRSQGHVLSRAEGGAAFRSGSPCIWKLFWWMLGT